MVQINHQTKRPILELKLSLYSLLITHQTNIFIKIKEKKMRDFFMHLLKNGWLLTKFDEFIVKSVLLRKIHSQDCCELRKTSFKRHLRLINADWKNCCELHLWDSIISSIPFILLNFYNHKSQLLFFFICHFRENFDHYSK